MHVPTPNKTSHRDFRRQSRVNVTRFHAHKIGCEQQGRQRDQAAAIHQRPNACASKPQSVPSTVMSGNVRMPATALSVRCRCSPTSRRVGSKRRAERRHWIP
jgi:hypothetical protein